MCIVNTGIALICANSHFRSTAEGEILQQYQQPLKLHEDGHVFIIFPLTVCHVIDSQSPFYHLSARDFVQGHFEILVTLSGASRSTGQCTEERTSYIAREVLWGNRFVNVVHYDPENRVHAIEYDDFDTTEQVRHSRGVVQDDFFSHNRVRACGHRGTFCVCRSIHRCAVRSDWMTSSMGSDRRSKASISRNRSEPSIITRKSTTAFSLIIMYGGLACFVYV